MHKYQVYQDNPEGIDWLIDLEHEKLFSQEDFIREMENVICETFEEEMKDPNAIVFKSSINNEKLIANLEKHGFRRIMPEAKYCFRPFDSEEEPCEKLRNILEEIETRRKERQKTRRQAQEVKKIPCEKNR